MFICPSPIHLAKIHVDALFEAFKCCDLHMEFLYLLTFVELLVSQHQEGKLGNSYIYNIDMKGKDCQKGAIQMAVKILHILNCAANYMTSVH